MDRGITQKILCSIKVVGNHRLFEYVLALDVEGIVRKHLGRSYPRHMETEWKIRPGRYSSPGSGIQKETCIRAVKHASVKIEAGIDDNRLTGHRIGAAHHDDHLGAVVLIGRPF